MSDANCAGTAAIPRRDRQFQTGHQPVEDLAGRAGAHAPAPVEAEQRRARIRRAGCLAALELFADQAGDARPMGDEAAFTELAAHHDEQVPLHVDVAQAQPAGLSGPQPEPVAKGEDRPVRRPSLGCAGVVGQGARRVEQPADLGGIKQERHPHRCHPPSADPKRRGCQ